MKVHIKTDFKTSIKTGIKAFLLFVAFVVSTSVYAQQPINLSQVGATAVSAAATPGDAAAGANAAPVFNFALLFNSSSYDRMRSMGVGQNVASTGLLGIYCGFNTSPTTISSGSFSPIGCDNADNLLVNLKTPLPAGTNVIGHVICDSGCSSSAGFADNTTFTAGTTAVNIAGGWYTTSPTNCTTGNACAPELTIDRKLFVQDFQGTSPWVDSCTVANCSINLGNWGGSALGTPTNFGTTPGAVISGSVNASLFSGTTALGTPNTFGTTAPTGNALGVNASLFVGTALVSGSAPVPISSTTAANTKTNPIFNAPSDGTNVITAAISALGTAPTGTEVETVQAVLEPFTSGGLSAAVGGSTPSQALTTTTNVKASAGQLYGYMIYNPNASAVFVEYYNTATTPGTIGATTNLILEFAVPGTGAANVNFTNGVAFSSGIAVAVATTATGAVAPGTGLTITTLFK